MAPRKPTVTSRSLQALLTRIGSASSGTKSVLLARFQRDVQRPGFTYYQNGRNLQGSREAGQKLRILSIDMGIKNLAFCDAEVSHPAKERGDQSGFNAHMDILRWKKLNLVGSSSSKSRRLASKDIQEAEADDVDTDSDLFSPCVLSKTAYHLIVTEVLSVKPDVILIEKQRWRSGGGSAVQQWTLRVNTLEAMLWAVLETLKPSRQSDSGREKPKDYQVHAVDPKRVGQYWLGQQAQALQEKNENALALDMAALSKPSSAGAEGRDENEEDGTVANPAKKTPSRSKAEKSAKIAILRSWLADDTMSTAPSTTAATPRITFNITASAASPSEALLAKSKAPRRRRASKTATADRDAGLVVDDMPATELKKLDDITDCFLQAAAWVAWESNRRQLLAVGSGDDKEEMRVAAVEEKRILKMIKECGEM